MDILLINPPVPLVRTKNTEIVRRTQPHFGLAQLATNLDKAGYTVGIIDAYPFSISEKTILRYVNKIKPKIIGLSTFSIALRELYSLVKALKEFKDIELILGGCHVSAQPQLLKVLNLKYALFGEADYSIIDLCNYLLYKKVSLEEISGLIYNNNGNLVINRYEELKDLDSLPLPSYRYYLTKVDTSVMYLVSSRGCRFRCTFCSKYGYRERVVFRSPELVVEDMKKIKRDYPSSLIIFTDENFTVNKERIIKICELLKQEKINIRWGCLARIDYIDEELINMMKNVGLETLLFGIESGVEEVRKKLGKPFKNEYCKKIINYCKKSGIITTAFFLLGMPDENLSDMNKTIEFARELEIDHVYFNTYVLTPASLLYERLKNEGIIDDNIWLDYMEGKREFPLYIPPYLSKNKLLAIEIKAHRKFYINWKLLRNLFDTLRFKIAFLILQDSIKRELVLPIVEWVKKILKLFRK